jgi:serine phosphatase RsbU (regulator of sigma subunit)
MEIIRKLDRFWRNVSAGLTVEELWSQFRRETRASVAVFSAETGRDVPEEWSQHKGRWPVMRAVGRAMFFRLSPARRIIFLLALVMMVMPQTQYSNGHGVRIVFQNSGFAAFLLLLLLVLELADRVSLKRDLEIAREMQRMLVPQAPPAVPGIDMAFATRPANTVAGDYYDAFLRAGGKSLMLFVADVAGKGIPSGLLMARFEASVHLLCDESAPLAEVMERLNRAICQRSGGGRHFITCFAAELELESRALTWVSAGHNPPLVARADGKVEWLAQGGFPLGMFPGARYEAGSGELRAGDRLVIYTDGVTEANDTEDGEFGNERLAKLAQGFGEAPAAECMKRVFAAVDEFAGTAPQADDITCLLMRVAAAKKATIHG